MNIENIPISEIKPYLNNPRKNDKGVDIVAQSIKQYGFRNPIILDKNNVIIAGHTRLKAAIQLGLNEVPVIWADDLTDEQVKGLRIMDNKSTEYADWDFYKLKLEFTELNKLDFDLSLTGFSEVELNKILPSSELEEDLPDPDKPKYEVKRGDIYQLGKHRLLCGNSINEEDVKLLLKGNKVNMILTDPPYGVNYAEKNAYLIEIGKPNRIETPIKNDNDELDVGILLTDYLQLTSFADYNTIYVFTRGKHIADFIYAFEKADCYYSQDLNG